jgi:hypothetical protein
MLHDQLTETLKRIADSVMALAEGLRRADRTNDLRNHSLERGLLELTAAVDQLRLDLGHGKKNGHASPIGKRGDELSGTVHLPGGGEIQIPAAVFAGAWKWLKWVIAAGVGIGSHWVMRKIERGGK